MADSGCLSFGLLDFFLQVHQNSRRRRNVAQSRKCHRVYSVFSESRSLANILVDFVALLEEHTEIVQNESDYHVRMRELVFMTGVTSGLTYVMMCIFTYRAARHNQFVRQRDVFLKKMIAIDLGMPDKKPKRKPRPRKRPAETTAEPEIELFPDRAPVPIPDIVIHHAPDYVLEEEPSLPSSKDPSSIDAWKIDAVAPSIENLPEDPETLENIDFVDPASQVEWSDIGDLSSLGPATQSDTHPLARFRKQSTPLRRQPKTVLERSFELEPLVDDEEAAAPVRPRRSRKIKDSNPQLSLAALARFHTNRDRLSWTHKENLRASLSRTLKQQTSADNLLRVVGNPNRSAELNKFVTSVAKRPRFDRGLIVHTADDTEPHHPPEQHDVPQAEYHDPQAEYHDPQMEYQDPHVAHHDPQAEYHDPQAEYQDPHVAHHAPQAEYHDPQMEHQDPHVAHHAPQAEYHDPQMEYQDPHVAHHDPQAEYHDPQMEYQDPHVAHHAPQTEYHDPQMEYQDPHVAHHDPQAEYHDPQMEYQDPHVAHHDPQAEYHDPQMEYQDPHVAHHDPQAEYHDPQMESQDPHVSHHDPQAEHHGGPQDPNLESEHVHDDSVTRVSHDETDSSSEDSSSPDTMPTKCETTSSVDATTPTGLLPPEESNEESTTPPLVTTPHADEPQYSGLGRLQLPRQQYKKTFEYSSTIEEQMKELFRIIRSMATRIYEKDGFWYKYTSMHEVVASVEKSKIPSTVNIILRLCEKKRLYLLQAPGSKSRVFIFPKQEVFRARSFKVVRVCRFPHPPPRVSQLLPFK